MSLYFECHVTIDPVFDLDLLRFNAICEKQGFKVAKLLMQKNKFDIGQDSDKDSFCTGHDKDYNKLYSKMINLLHDLKEYGFKIRRYKIEDIILDSRNDNKYFKL